MGIFLHTVPHLCLLEPTPEDQNDIDVCTSSYFRGSIVVSIPACHAGDPGSIPGLGVTIFDSSFERFIQFRREQKGAGSTGT